MHFKQIKQIAEETGVTKQTVYRWITTGLLKSTRMGSKHRITPEQFEAFVRRCNPEENGKA
jgi:excisionase family DNA binding protein